MLRDRPLKIKNRVPFKMTINMTTVPQNEIFLFFKAI